MSETVIYTMRAKRNCKDGRIIPGALAIAIPLEDGNYLVRLKNGVFLKMDEESLKENFRREARRIIILTPPK